MSETDRDFRIVPIDETMLERCWQLRLRALKEEPEAFGQPYEEAAALPDADVRNVFETFWTGGDNQVFVAIADDGTIAGMTGVVLRSHRPKNRHRADIWGVYVAPEYRGRGLSSRLLETTIAYCRSVAGVLQVHLQVISTNVAAVRSYRRAGFVRWGRMPRADILDGIALDHDFMVLMLDELLRPTTFEPEGTLS